MSFKRSSSRRWNQTGDQPGRHIPTEILNSRLGEDSFHTHSVHAVTCAVQGGTTVTYTMCCPYIQMLDASLTPLGCLICIQHQIVLQSRNHHPHTVVSANVQTPVGNFCCSHSFTHTSPQCLLLLLRNLVRYQSSKMEWNSEAFCDINNNLQFH